MNIRDKKNISRKKFCPPHCLFHKLPISEKIINENCHVHKKKWRKAHHILFCKYLKCQHFNFMIKKSQLENKQKKLI